MTATTLGYALKQCVESFGLSLAAYRDGAPPDEPMPFVTIDEGVSVVTDGYADGGVGETVSELVTVHLWESWKDEDDNVVESPTLANAVARGLHGAELDTAPMRVYGVSVVSRRRLLEPATNTVHNAITAKVRRLT